MNLAGISPVAPQSATPNAPIINARGTASGAQSTVSEIGLSGTGETSEDSKTNAQTGVSETSRNKNPGTPGTPQLDEYERKQLDDLKARDREVRAHEAAHKSAAGNLAHGGATYSYEKGPDGQRYAVGGEVKIDTSKVADDPEATLEKANKIRAAALAPADPSSQDRAVAAKASQMAAQARSEIAKQKLEENSTEMHGLNMGQNNDDEAMGKILNSQATSTYQNMQKESENPYLSGSMLNLVT